MSLSEESRQLEQSNSTLTNLYTEKIRKAALKAAIDIAVNKLVSAKNHLHSSNPKAHFDKDAGSGEQSAIQGLLEMAAM